MVTVNLDPVSGQGGPNSHRLCFLEQADHNLKLNKSLVNRLSFINQRQLELRQIVALGYKVKKSKQAVFGSTVFVI